MDARAIIAMIRDGAPVGRAELSWFADGLADGRVSDAQAGAFAMAVLLKGLGDAGRTALTLAMRDSGRRLDWSVDGPVIDKHSTGGVGDCVSLVLAPALAACGAIVPMISGRGLGHTGGTLDKLESIPGITTQLDEAQFRAVVARAGCAIVSASAEMAPADRRLYAVRDVTATVESLDLITASILSKKLAAGLEGLVLDVKAGSGAFMKCDADARALAAALVETANAAGCRTSAVVSDMNQPLAPALGNALEMAEAMRVLRGDTQGRLGALTIELAGEALRIGGMAATREAGAQMVSETLSDGRAAAHFGRMVAAMGGPNDFVENWEGHLPEAVVIRDLPAPCAGHVTAMDGESMGLAVIGLGGGRQVEADKVNPAVGLDRVLPLGASVARGDPLLRIHATSEDDADRAAEQLLRATVIRDAPAQIPALIHERLG
ncbi:thymidine phosphorylase [Roseovarius halotolerans]|uniref:Thymidine phosphorylase n=1 Tax=Roseovarius halotolerans TaxID=505353 RepID=A0A1X6ZHQ6_9RHOB|nr:thymidine phosphorylase [Roseovarius halotolerans]RKT30906.1 thymidine phosphorylase [Roseovarius halotolerans]SLN51207.1 Thymidine phosphorylase [Roseovarius halotolerans]